MIQSNILLRYPSLRTFFNLRTNIAALSFISCSIPLFLMGHVTMGIAFSLGSISCGFADTSSVTKYRIYDFAIALPLFFLISLGIELVFPHSWLFASSLAIVSFVLFMLAVLTPRLGAIGFAAILLAIYAMLLHQEGRPVWLIPMWLTGGAVWYIFWQALAITFLPNQESKDILSDLYQALAKKLMIHDQGFVFATDKNQLFIKSARFRSQIATLSHTLEYRIHQQFSCGEDSAKLQDMYRFLKISEHINEQTRLMYFTSTPYLKQYCPQWLEQIHSANQQISQYLAQVTVNNVHYLALPKVDFDALRSYQVPKDAQQEAIAAQSFINKLDIIFLSLCELKNQSNTIASPTVSKPIILNWKWRDIVSKLTSQMTLKSSYFRHALRGTLSLTTGLIIVRLLNLDFGFWTLMTSLLILRPNLSMTWTRLLQRLTGTICGLVVVSGLLHFQVSTDILPFIFCIAAVLFFHTSARHYGFAVFFVTLFVFAGFSLNGQGDNIMLPRLDNTVLGVFIPLIFVFILTPGWQKKSFPTQLNTTIKGYIDYLISLKTYLANKQDLLAENVQHNFQNCVVNDTNLFDHWIGYLGEPHFKSQTSEHILLCSRSSNIILRILTQLNENKLHLMPDSDINSDIDHAIMSLKLLQQKLHQSSNHSDLFQHISKQEKLIYQSFTYIENEIYRLDNTALLMLLSKEVRSFVSAIDHQSQ
ncbi:FUSC family membrane protein [Photobacterium aquimaris]|uniref:Inner membrane protein YccS n=1 Tax=Photobacterium aquimaris TaxID=512643 RepID=A0A1Y6KVX5_9GAMM|nr:FUSC family membrane protein [Photobacterium aquimaris]SMY16202.1 Inner membrane protein YccS [Photobacterium aquimaris]